MGGALMPRTPWWVPTSYLTLFTYIFLHTEKKINHAYQPCGWMDRLVDVVCIVHSESVNRRCDTVGSHPSSQRGHISHRSETGRKTDSDLCGFQYLFIYLFFVRFDIYYLGTSFLI